MNDQCIYKSIQVMETYKKKNLNGKLCLLKILYLYIELLQVTIHNKNKPVEQKKKNTSMKGLVSTQSIVPNSHT